MNDHIQTAIRWRPVVQNREVCIEKVNNKILSVGRQFQPFLFDHVFDSSAATDSQAEVYNELVKPLIDRAFEGYNCTFLAIGQTGSGKTYTVGFDQSVNSEHNGMTARVLKSIFSYQNAEQVKVLISFIEIYNKQAFDLLAENKENKFDEPTKMSIKSENDVLSLLAQASKRRHIRHTTMNSVSSRSHAVFTICLGIKHAEMDIRESVINIVDLAGSEGFGKTGNILGSEAHMEGKCINESLSAFKRVINAMACGQKHIPFLDTLITKFLKKALNSQSYLTLLGCVSPYQDDYGETISTIRFVSEAKQIKRTPQLNAMISDFQKTKTPVKTVLRTPNSTLNLTTTNTIFKRPASMSTGIPNKRSFSISKMKSVPPKKLSFTPNSSSTTKKSTIFNRQNQSDSFAGNKPKAVANIFPMPLTPSRRLIENLLNNKNNESNDSIINFSDASTSSAMNSINHQPLSPSSLSSSEGIQSQLSKIVNLLAGPAFQLLSSEVKKRMVENSDQKLRPNQIMESFHAVLNKLLLQDASKESLPPKNHVELSPLAEKSDESEMATASSSNQAETFNNEKSAMEKHTSSSIDGCIAVDVNHTAKQIIVGVLATPLDTLPSPSSILVPDFREITSQNENNVKARLVDYSLSESENSADETEELNQLESLDPTASIDEIDKTTDKSYETPINASMTVQLTPIANKQNASGAKRTSIGMIRLRHDISNDTIDDHSIYEILMVEKDRISSLKKVRFSPVDRIIIADANENEDDDDDTDEASNGKIYPFPASNAIASKMTASDHRFPIAPQMVLDRIHSLQEYNRNIAMQNMARVTAESMRMKPQQNRKLTKGNTQGVPPVQPRSKSAVIIKNILNILNSGTQKDLTRLVTIGPKTAALIFQNREERGQFECVDAILRMPFWSKKKHRRFLELNVHC